MSSPHPLTVGTLTIDDELEPHVPLHLTHPDDCTYNTTNDDYDCPILFEFTELGPWAALLGVWWDWRTPTQQYPAPGTYTVTYWQTKYDIPGEPIEYDAGLDFEAAS